MRNPIPAVVLLVLLILSVPSPAADPGFPLVQSLVSFPFDEDAPRLEPGQVAASFTLSGGNVFMVNGSDAGEYDFETLEAVLALRIGISRTFTLEIYSRWSGIYGGWMDGMIEGFHDTFGLPDNRRPMYTRARVVYSFLDLFEHRRSVGVTGPFTLALNADLARGRHFGMGGRLALQASPAGMPGLLSERPALIAGMWLRWERGSRELGISGDVAFFKTPEWLEGIAITPRIIMMRAWFRLGWFRTGIAWRSSPYRSGDEADAGLQILLGFRIFRGIEFRIQEDLAPFHTTPDIRFGIRLRLDELARRLNLE